MGKRAEVSRAGFTLIEVMLTIALIALLSTVFVYNISSLLRDTDIRSLENEYWRAVDAAKTKAVYGQKPYRVEWLPKETAFVISSSGDTQRFEMDTSALGDVEVEVVFEEASAENSFILVDGQLVRQREVTDVTFYPDGTCTPFSVTLRIGDYMNQFKMDPWTGARLVESDDES